MSKSPLEMFCPKCGKWGAHPVQKTDTTNFHCGKEAAKMFERIAGRDISYRMRTKKCFHCGDEFETAEMSYNFLKAMIEEISRLQEVEESSIKNSQYAITLRNTINNIAALANIPKIQEIPEKTAAHENIDQIKQLIDIGKKKGILTFDQINDTLPPEIVTSQQIDYVINMLHEEDIEIIDIDRKGVICIKQLIDIGKQKGTLTLEQINDILPPEIVTSQQIDYVINMLREEDIEIIDIDLKGNIRKHLRLVSKPQKPCE